VCIGCDDAVEGRGTGEAGLDSLSVPLRSRPVWALQRRWSVALGRMSESRAARPHRCTDPRWRIDHRAAQRLGPTGVHAEGVAGRRRLGWGPGSRGQRLDERNTLPTLVVLTYSPPARQLPVLGQLTVPRPAALSIVAASDGCRAIVAVQTPALRVSICRRSQRTRWSVPMQRRDHRTRRSRPGQGVQVEAADPARRLGLRHGSGARRPPRCSSVGRTIAFALATPTSRLTIAARTVVMARSPGRQVVVAARSKREPPFKGGSVALLPPHAESQ
jgi:hypothetical protein